MLHIGDILEEKYRVIGFLGKGGTGRVYLAENVKLGNHWAVKEIDLGRRMRVNLLAESEILKKINHPRLPRIVDIAEKGKFLYIIEDYFEGINLREVIKSREMCSEKNLIQWGRQLCEILIYLHNIKPNPIIYRDMKPGNIIIDSDNNVKLIDLGIAREYKEGQDSDTVYIGTRGYAAPEQYSGANQTDERTDIYGLGATLYHVATGLNPNDPPYHVMPVRQVNKALSMDTERIIAKCTHSDPALRYQSAKELMKDLSCNRAGGDHETQLGIKKLPGITSKLIIIGSLSARAGSSFITANLAAATAARGISTAVIEFPVNTPYFYDALFIRQKSEEYISWPHEIQKGCPVDWKKVFIDNGVSWIVLEPTLFSIKDWSGDNMMQLVYSTKQVPIVFLDVSTNWDHPSIRSVLLQADYIFLVVDPDPVLIDRTADCNYDNKGIPEDVIPHEYKTVKLLSEVGDKGSSQVEIIINKHTRFIDRRLLRIPFEPAIVFPYMEPAEVYRALWEGNLLYNNSDSREVFDSALRPVIEKLIPGDFIAQNSEQVDIVSRMKAAYKMLRGEKWGL
ncbi:MAG: protein kinase domain-containing protein [Eubacteriales bacterium]